MGEVGVRVYHDRGSQLAKAMRVCRYNRPAYPSAAALLAVHGAIAYNDAVQIKLTGDHLRTKDHGQAIAAIKRACGTAKIEPHGVAQLRKLLSMKTDNSSVTRKWITNSPTLYALPRIGSVRSLG